MMAVNQLRDFLENGNIRNSVNFPGCQMGTCTGKTRLSITHLNVKKMINQFTEILSDNNIVNMANASRGEYAYTLLDMEDEVAEEKLEQLRSAEGVLRLRVID